MKYVVGIIIFIVFFIVGILAFCQIRNTAVKMPCIETILYEKDGMKIRELALGDSPYGLVRVFIAEKGDDWQMSVK
jgi:hypothetical protein